MSRFSSFISVLCRILVNLSFCLSAATALSAPKRPVVAITQIAPHPSLDAIKRGILDELKAQKMDVQIIDENAQGNMALAAQIAAKFVSLNPTVIVPITTPSAVAIYAATKETNIPVIFSAVSDPVAAKLVPSMTQAGKNITGVSDLSPIAAQVALIRKMLPNAQKIGVLYNAGEANSVTLIDLFEKEAQLKGLKIIRITAPSSAAVPTAAEALLGQQVDALYIPNDNTVISAFDSVLKVVDKKIPIFTADPDSVQRGALASVAHNQYTLGRETGKMVASILRGVSIDQLPPRNPQEAVKTTVNEEIAKQFGIM